MFLLFSTAIAASDATPLAAATRLWGELTRYPGSAASLDGGPWSLVHPPGLFGREGERDLTELAATAFPVVDSKREREISEMQAAEVVEARAASCAPHGPAMRWEAAPESAPQDWLAAWPGRAQLRASALVPLECGDGVPRALALTETDAAGWRVVSVLDEDGAKRWAVLGLTTHVDLTGWRTAVAAGAAEATAVLDAARTDGVTVVHWSEAQVKIKKTPAFPDAAKRMGLTRARCLVQILVDEKGSPSSVTFPRCAPPFIDAARAAAGAWLWYPMQVNGVAKPMVFTINFAFEAAK